MKKICTNCKQEKLLVDFYKRSMVPDGHCSECKECSKKRNKRTHRNYYLSNKEKILKRNLKYRETFRESYNKNRNSQLKGSTFFYKIFAIKLTNHHFINSIKTYIC